MAFLNFLRSKAEDKRPLLERCLSIDLEVNPKTSEIFDFAAICYGDELALISAKGRIKDGLDRLEKALAKFPHVIGHNVLRHDIEYLGSGLVLHS